MALVPEVAIGMFVGRSERLQILRTSEAEFGGNATPPGRTPLRRQWLFLEIESQIALRLQRAPDVDAGKMAIEASEGDVTGGMIGAEPAQGHMQCNATPLHCPVEITWPKP